MKLNADQIRDCKAKTLLSILTAYTNPIAKLLEKAGIPILLVGDTVGMVEMGFDTTRKVTMDHMVYHVGAVRRGAPNTHVIGDMPYGSDKTAQIALSNALRLLEAGADSIKIEGPQYKIIETLVSNAQNVP